MAKPQTENGFVMVALDLFAALMVADLPNRCMIVLSFHLIHSYGPAKQRDVLLDPLTVSEHTHLHPNNVRRAVKELVAADMLRRQKGGAYRFNKDYESWKPGGKALADRLGGGPLEFAAWALARYAPPIKASKKDAIQRDCETIKTSEKDAIQRDCTYTSTDNPVGLPPTKVTESNGIASFANGVYMGDDVNNCDETISDDSVVRDRAPARENLDLRELRSLSPAGRAPNLRKPDDMALIREAIQLLGSSPNTEHLAMEVGRVHNSSTNISIPGWKWVVAAYAACRTSGHVGDGPMRWKYFFGIVRDASRGEYDRIRAEAAIEPATSEAAPRPPRRRTQAEERKAQSEAIHRAAAALPDDPEES